jgi:hypothetical protein
MQSLEKEKEKSNYLVTISNNLQALKETKQVKSEYGFARDLQHVLTQN